MLTSPGYMDGKLLRKTIRISSLTRKPCNFWWTNRKISSWWHYGVQQLLRLMRARKTTGSLKNLRVTDMKIHALAFLPIFPCKGYISSQPREQKTLLFVKHVFDLSPLIGKPKSSKAPVVFAFWLTLYLSYSFFSNTFIPYRWKSAR